ncbi:mas-related G-protein coupled receptor member H-like [Ambystoma mexicanum]|uniref:mas-related G-protein coupled receptor member H-like n=1 Tax=Ambystoma mexicanum TaxID=8296 RepID=UPI0037E94F5A
MSEVPDGPTRWEDLASSLTSTGTEDYDIFADFNDTENDYSEYSSYVAVFSFLIAICLFGVAGNGIVFWNLMFRISRSPFTTYILNLATADFLFLLIFSMTFLILLMDMHGLINTAVSYEIPVAVALFGYLTSQCLLTSISVERCLSILYPIWYQCHRPRHQSAIVCTIFWALSCTILAVELFYFGQTEESTGLDIFLNVLLFCIFLPLMILSNLILLIRICKTSMKRHPPRPYILIITTVLVFLILSAPFSLISFLEMFHIASVDSFAMVFFFSFCLNSSLNPIIYFLVGSLRRRGQRGFFKGALRNAFKEEPESSQLEESTSTHQESLRMSAPL